MAYSMLRCTHVYVGVSVAYVRMYVHTRVVIYMLNKVDSQTVASHQSHSTYLSKFPHSKVSYFVEMQIQSTIFALLEQAEAQHVFASTNSQLSKSEFGSFKIENDGDTGLRFDAMYYHVT